MSLIRTDYVPEWRISAHAQSVLVAGQKHHSFKPSAVHPCTHILVKYPSGIHMRHQVRFDDVQSQFINHAQGQIR